MVMIRIHDQEMIHFLSGCSHVFDKIKVSIDSDSIHTEQAETSRDILSVAQPVSLPVGLCDQN